MAVTPTVSPLRHTNTSLRLNQESLPSSVQRPESQTLGVMAWDT
jgi:hypothetical protein